MTPTWIVWSVSPPANPEKICCTSMLDAARGWAERQFQQGMLAHTGTELMVRNAHDPAGTVPAVYRVRISIPNAPAFRASLIGLAHEAVSRDSTGSKDGR